MMSGEHRGNPAGRIEALEEVLFRTPSGFTKVELQSMFGWDEQTLDLTIRAQRDFRAYPKGRGKHFALVDTGAPDFRFVLTTDPKLVEAWNRRAQLAIAGHTVTAKNVVSTMDNRRGKTAKRLRASHNLLDTMKNVADIIEASAE